MPGPEDVSVNKTNTTLFSLQSTRITIIQSYKIYLLHTYHMPNEILGNDKKAMYKKERPKPSFK